MPRWLFKIGGAGILALLIASGAWYAAGPRSLAAIGRVLPANWSARDGALQRQYAGVIPPPWSNTDSVIATMQQRLRANDQDERSYVTLGEAYAQKAREVGDPAYYSKADAVLQRALRLQANDAEAIAAQASLALDRHQFQEALRLGQRAQALNPYDAGILGIISDADVQLGNDTAAVQVTQGMVNLRPDLSSYSRVSYLRELHGDLPGAIAAMQRAATAGGPAPENVAWTDWQLGTLYFNQGDLNAAQHEFEQALVIFPRYVHGEAGLAMVAAARGDYDGAIAHYTAALNVMPWPQYIINLGDVYAAAGRQQDAEREYGLVGAIEELFRANSVNVDAELALFDADHHRQLPQALALARQNAKERPSVMADDALAWTLYQSGDCPGAAQAERDALRLGTEMPLMLFHAGMIAQCSGDRDAATRYLNQTLSLNPHFSVLYDGVAERALRELGAGRPGIATVDLRAEGM
ncbi:MAG TPA: tetratricopeptide repeat protein [Chloroflexota bacterium]|nr:tetratricopeptide repeat protein [Chloroflexota bacterium]